MAERPPSPLAPLPRSLDAQRVVRVFLAVAGIGAAFAIFDLALVRVARQHQSEASRQLFTSANTAVEEGRLSQALELFRAARNRSPEDAEYQLAFAWTLRALGGRERETQLALEDLLRRYPSHGAANTEMARLLAQKGDWQQAAWFYHRALYGEWAAPADLTALRFELAEMLAGHGEREQLLSEVVLLDASAGEPQSRRLARLQLAAGDWDRAERSYRQLLRSRPSDPGLLTGQARAHFGAGRYLAAERVYRRAAYFTPGDAEVEKELRLAQEINESDPTLRRLSGKERHRRAHALVAALLTSMQACAQDHPLLTEAERALGSHERTSAYGRAAEADLEMLEHFWTARQEFCAKSLDLPQPVELLARQLTK